MVVFVFTELFWYNFADIGSFLSLLLSPEYPTKEETGEEVLIRESVFLDGHKKILVSVNEKIKSN